MNLKWVDARGLQIEGKGWTETAGFYHRLPAKAAPLVRPAVWNLSKNSAGIAVRFASDASSLSVRWKLVSTSLAMPHMAATGVSGVDLYARDAAKWKWVAVGKPNQPALNEQLLIDNLRRVRREYLLYLPLYNEVESLELGIPEDATIFEETIARKGIEPLVFYGTSIVQGASASRPGMAYPAIVGRKLDWPVINLGFSGNGLMEEEIADLLAEIDAKVYVLDCLPNLSDKTRVEERTPKFVEILRRKRPHTPIVLVENIQYPDVFIHQNKNRVLREKNAALRRVYHALVASGTKNLHLIVGDDLIGDDGEGTVDGVHPNDLGFSRMASALEPLLKRILSAPLSSNR